MVHSAGVPNQQAPVMQITATNGNARNSIKGQRVTITARSGQAYSKYLAAGNAFRRARYRNELLDFAKTVAAVESFQRHGVVNPMCELFATCKARLIIVHGRRFI